MELKLNSRIKYLPSWDERWWNAWGFTLGAGLGFLRRCFPRPPPDGMRVANPTDSASPWAGCVKSGKSLQGKQGRNPIRRVRISEGAPPLDTKRTGVRALRLWGETAPHAPTAVASPRVLCGQGGLLPCQEPRPFLRQKAFQWGNYTGREKDPAGKVAQWSRRKISLSGEPGSHLWGHLEA